MKKRKKCWLIWRGGTILFHPAPFARTPLVLKKYALFQMSTALTLLLWLPLLMLPSSKGTIAYKYTPEFRNQPWPIKYFEILFLHVFSLIKAVFQIDMPVLSNLPVAEGSVSKFSVPLLLMGLDVVILILIRQVYLTVRYNCNELAHMQGSIKEIQYGRILPPLWPSK